MRHHADRHVRPRRRAGALATLLASVSVVACGGEDPDPGAGGAPGSGATTAPAVGPSSPDVSNTMPTLPPVSATTPTVSAPLVATTVPVPPSSTVDDVAATTSASAAPQAEVIGTMELGRTDLGFLIGDGEYLWASGKGGVIVRVEPDSGVVDEITLADVSVPGDLLPAVEGDRMWWSALGGSSVIPIDRVSMAQGAAITLSAPPGLVIAGPGDRLWVEQAEGPASLHPVHADGTVGPSIVLSDDDEVVGATAAFDALWVPLFDAGTVLRLSLDGEVADEIEVGYGPRFAREVGGRVWVANAIDATLVAIDPVDLSTMVVELDAAGPAVDAPGGVVATTGAVWTRAAALDDRRALVYRIDPDTGSVVGVRTLPDGLPYELVGGMATVGDRLFVLDRSSGLLLELDTEQFTRTVAPASPPTTDAPSPDEAEVAGTVRTLLSTETTPEDMAAGIVDGDRLTEVIAGFKQFFVDNLPGQQYEGEVLTSSIDGDDADVTFVVTVADEPIVEPISGSLVREGDGWLLTAESFCRLVATGGLTCPADLID